MAGVMVGDWNCASCGDHQFARNVACRKCGAAKPDEGGAAAAWGGKGGCGGGGGDELPPGDWSCPNCGDHQFARNLTCRKCGTPRPAGAGLAANGGCYSGGHGGGFNLAIGHGGGSAGKGGKTSGDWNCPGCGDLQFARNAVCRKCGHPSPKGNAPAAAWGGGAGGMADAGSVKGGKPGDWMCPSCGDHQFARNEVCRKCGTPNPGGASGGAGAGTAWGGAVASGGCGGGGTKGGDWICSACGDLQFARNTVCRRCGNPAPGGAGGPQFCSGGGKGGKGEMWPGDWRCPNCQDVVFAKNASCRKCGTAKPAVGSPGPSAAPGWGAGGKGQLVGGGGKGGSMPGDWICPNCSDLQFARNTECRKCGTPKPEDDGALAAAGAFGGKGAFGGQAEKPGDWYCESCGDLQFARNVVCRKCGAAKPQEGGDARERSRSPKQGWA